MRALFMDRKDELLYFLKNVAFSLLIFELIFTRIFSVNAALDEKA